LWRPGSGSRASWEVCGALAERTWLTIARIDARIDALALALAAGKTITEAAVAADLSRRTATRRVIDPAFRRRVAELRAEMVARALGKMADGMAAAAETLRALLDAEGESVRLGAARSILELGNKLREAVELEERLATLEQRLAARGEP
jgi:hypothetical protein